VERSVRAGGGIVKQTTRHALHAVICIAAFFPWLVGVLGFGAALALTVLADKLWPNATWGNCWTYVGPRWFKHGGYVQMRLVKCPKIFGRSFIPHAIWLRESHPEAKLEQTEPMTRIKRLRDAWQTIYFRFYIHTSEPHRRPDGDNTAPGGLP
jgi:hypothetical protein